MREFSVGLTTRLSRSPWHNAAEAADHCSDLLAALQENARAIGPMTSCHHDPPVVGVWFNVNAGDAEAAIREAKAILADALERVGLPRDIDLIEVEVQEFNEEELERLRAELVELAEGTSEYRVTLTVVGREPDALAGWLDAIREALHRQSELLKSTVSWDEKRGSLTAYVEVSAENSVRAFDVAHQALFVAIQEAGVRKAVVLVGFSVQEYRQGDAAALEPTGESDVTQEPLGEEESQTTHGTA